MMETLWAWYLLAITPPAFPGIPTPPVESRTTLHSLPRMRLGVNERPPLASWWTPLECQPGSRVKRIERADGVAFFCLNANTNQYSGESRGVVFGHRMLSSRRYRITPGPEEKSVQDGLAYRYYSGYPGFARMHQMGEEKMLQKWVQGYLREVAMQDERGRYQAWSYQEDPPDRPSTYSYSYSDGRTLDIRWNAQGRIDSLMQRKLGVGLFGRWIEYESKGRFALFARCGRSFGKGSKAEYDEPDSRTYAWQMPKTFKFEGGPWVSLADAETARTRPCEIDGERISPILPSEIPTPASYPRQPIVYALTHVVHVDLPAMAGRKAGRVHILLYDLLKDAGPWRFAAMEALELYGRASGKLPHQIADDAFKALWLRERRADIGLTRAHQIELVRQMLTTLSSDDRAALMARHNLHR